MKRSSEEISSGDEELSKDAKLSPAFPVVKISEIGGSSDSINGAIFFQQDEQSIIIDKKSNFSGGYTCNLNTCLAVILIRDNEIEVAHLSDVVTKGTLHSLSCDSFIIVDGGEYGIRQDVYHDPHVLDEDKEKEVKDMLDEREKRVTQMRQLIMGHNDCAIRFSRISSPSGAIFVNKDGEVSELKEHRLSLINQYRFDFSDEELHHNDYKFDVRGNIELVEKSPHEACQSDHMQYKQSVYIRVV